ncbi:hypothetical protein [Mycolicibacterium fortuitum]|uniref:hypothetical protein n=1 Tax=Mycolicibacterium fortuitum TaxID=1766 RepID=UPI0010545763|nr:hypothetical protein [Mycolicibacterium fortuitum]
MQLALRPFTTAGVALVGAGVIAVSPLAPPPAVASATTPVSTAAVQLSAAVDPLTNWVEVIETSVTKVGILADLYMERPLPIATEVAKNLQTYASMVGATLPKVAAALQNWAETIAIPGIQKAIDEILAGQFTQAASSLISPLSLFPFQLADAINLVAIPRMIAGHLYGVANLIFNAAALSPLMNIPIGLVSDTIRQIGATAQGVSDAFNAGDPVEGLTTLVNFPADLTGRVLNKPRGLLDYYTWGSCGCLQSGGAIFNQLIDLPRRIADQLVIPPTAAATATSAPLALSVASTEALPPASNTETEPASEPTTGSASADAAAAPANSKEPDSVEADGAEVHVSPEGATDLSDSTKTKLDKTGTTTSKQAQKLRASLQRTADEVDKSAKKLRSNIEKSVKKVSDRISTAGKKKAAASSAASSKNDNAGSSSDSGSDD